MGTPTSLIVVFEKEIAYGLLVRVARLQLMFDQRLRKNRLSTAWRSCNQENTGKAIVLPELEIGLVQEQLTCTCNSITVPVLIVLVFGGPKQGL